MTPSSRHQVLEAARQRAELTLYHLWLDYMSFSGVAGIVEVEAYLHGLMPLDPHQEDILAHVVNERLDDLYRAARVPYNNPEAEPGPGRPVDLIDEQLNQAKRARKDK